MNEHKDNPQDVRPDGQEEQRPLSPAALLAEALYDITAREQVAGAKWLKANPPAGMEAEALPPLLAGIDAGTPNEALRSAAVVPGRKDRYYYDAGIMTPQFAQLSALLMDKDILHTIATVTRSDSKLYPRPTEFGKLKDYPFRFTADEVEGAAARMAMDDRYKDIGVVSASNGEKAFFCRDSLSEGYARSLLEASEVESKEWP